MFKACIFDMDGVLVDTEWMWEEYEFAKARELGIDLDARLRDRFIGADHFKLWRCVKKAYGLDIDVTAIALEESAVMEQRYREYELKIVPGAIELMYSLRENGILIAVGTSNTEQNARLTLERMGLKDKVDCLSSFDAVGTSKPEPDIFLHAAKSLNVLPCECAVIDDAENGVSAAKAAGMTAIGYTGGVRELLEADLRISDFRKLDYGVIAQAVDKCRSTEIME